MRCSTITQLIVLENELFGNTHTRGNKELREAMRKLRDRLLSEQVLPGTHIERREFMIVTLYSRNILNFLKDKCLSILDMSTELVHSPWLWLFRVSEMIQDVGHRCVIFLTLTKIEY